MGLDVINVLVFRVTDTEKS